MTHNNTGFRNILAAVDGSEESMEAADFAISMAKTYGAHLTVLYVLRTPVVGNDEVVSGLEMLLDECRKAANEWLMEIKEKGRHDEGVEVETKIVQGVRSEYQQIVTFAQSINADLIVMGSRGMSGFKKLLLGSVASGVVTYASCPVLVVK